MHPIVLAVFSNLFFAGASVYFTEYSRKISSEWMNFAKASVATMSFFIICLSFGYFISLPQESLTALIVSGAIGLMIGDIFLLKAFVHLGPGRVLMVFGFQPLLIGLIASQLLGQAFPLAKLIAVIFLILCLFTFSLESFKQKGHWELRGLTYAIIGVILDAAGILLTRRAFETAPELSPFFANFIRSLTATLGFLLLSLFWKGFTPIKTTLSLPKKTLSGVALAGFFGTFVSLSFYLMAIQSGHLASITAIAGTSPLFATLIETIRGKKSVNAYLVLGIFFFLCGFTILVFV